jgi:hypothetical protein
VFALDRQLCGDEIQYVYVVSESAAPVREHRMQTSEPETAETFGRPPQTTAVAISAFSRAGPANVKFESRPLAR